MRTIRRVVVLVLLALARLQGQPSTSSVFPGETWERVARAELGTYGWSADLLQKATTFIRDDSNTTGSVVVDRGRIVYQHGDIQELSYVASVRKSILSML
jgi:hypothetical protein